VILSLEKKTLFVVRMRKIRHQYITRATPSWYNSSHPNSKQWFYWSVKSLFEIYYFLKVTKIRSYWLDLYDPKVRSFVWCQKCICSCVNLFGANVRNVHWGWTPKYVTLNGFRPQTAFVPKVRSLKIQCYTDIDKTPNIKHEGKDQYGRVTITERSLNVHTVWHDYIFLNLWH
jgi:hypothetical protein